MNYHHHRRRPSRRLHHLHLPPCCRPSALPRHSTLALRPCHVVVAMLHPHRWLHHALLRSPTPDPPPRPLDLPRPHPAATGQSFSGSAEVTSALACPLPVLPLPAPVIAEFEPHAIGSGFLARVRCLATTCRVCWCHRGRCLHHQMQPLLCSPVWLCS
jgi:hypothetical protein